MDRQLFPVFLILGYIGFRLLMKVFYPVFVLIHELGHAIPARLTGRDEVCIAIGVAPLLLRFHLFGIAFNLGSKDLHTGYTTYVKPESESVAARCFIFGTAPLLSLMLVIAGIFLWRTFTYDTLGYFILASAWLANVHIAFNSLWSFGMDQDSPESGSSRSDLLNLIRTLRKS